MDTAPISDPRTESDPYLASMAGDATQSVTVMEWARYLGRAFGADGAIAALRYYEEVNWISENVRRTMVDYVRGLSLEELTRVEDAEVKLGDTIEVLEGSPFEKHAKSLWFIAAITGDNIEYDLIPLRLTEGDELSPDARVPSPGENGGSGGMGDRLSKPAASSVEPGAASQAEASPADDDIADAFDEESETDQVVEPATGEFSADEVEELAWNELVRVAAENGIDVRGKKRAELESELVDD
ncbi:FlaD/FlaE family flagellar protein [Halobacteriaceae archaeon GCM10025711]